MQYFESSGVWFPADDSTNAVGGTLAFTEEGLRLKLMGSFGQGWSPEVERYPVIRGVVDGSPYGTFATLLDCFLKNSSFGSSGLILQSYLSTRGIFGRSPFPDGPVEIVSTSLKFPYLSEWSGISGVEKGVSEDPRFWAKYRQPDVHEFQFGDKSLRLVSTAKASSGDHSYSLEEEIELVIGPFGMKTLRELGDPSTQLLQNLLSFATDTPNTLDTIKYHGPQDEQGWRSDYFLVYHPIFDPKNKKKSVYRHEMLFTFQDAQAAGLNIFQRWLDFSRRQATFCTVYFSSLYAPPRYLDEKLARLMSAFRLLISTSGGASQRTKSFLDDIGTSAKSHFSDDELALLRPAMPTALDIEMPFELLRHLTENADVMGQLIKDFPGFVRSVCDTLNYFERRSSPNPPLQGAALFHAFQKIQVLVKLLVLKELGFSQEAANAYIQRNKYFDFLKTHET